MGIQEFHFYLLPAANLTVLVAIYIKLASLDRRVARLEGIREGHLDAKRSM